MAKFKKTLQLSHRFFATISDEAFRSWRLKEEIFFAKSEKSFWAFSLFPLRHIFLVYILLIGLKELRAGAILRWSSEAQAEN